MQLKTFASLFATLLVALSAPIRAQLDLPHEQPVVTVTASRRLQTIDDTLAHATVINRAEIEAVQARDLLELLRRKAGVDIARTGGPGQSTSVFLRGTNANHVLVLIDGVRVASTNQGAFDFAHLPLGQIERIEIVRGPRAAWWGSDAIGGVIQIFTRTPEGGSVSVRGGSLGYGEAQAGVGGETGEAAWAATAGIIDVDGISAQAPGSFAYDPDDDGFRNRHVSLRGSNTLGTQRVGGTLIATESDVEFDQGESAVRTASGGASLAGPLGPHWQHAAALGVAYDRLDTPEFFSLFRSSRATLDWQVSRVDERFGETVLGVQGLRESGESIDTFADAASYDRTRRNFAAFGTWARDFGAQRLEAAVRHDDNSQFGGETTAQAAWGWRAGARTRVYASWGQGFRAPNFNELYFPGFGGDFAGNPELDPESSRSLEAGLVFLPAAGHELRVDAWRTRIDDLVSFSGPAFSAINIRAAAIDGVELVYRWRGDAWHARVDATWQDARDEMTGLDLPRRPQRKASTEIGYRFSRGIEVALAADAVAERFDPFGPLPGYTLLHATFDWRFTEQWRLQFRADNLTDRTYQLAAGFAQPERTFLATLVWTTGEPRP